MAITLQLLLLFFFVCFFILCFFYMFGAAVAVFQNKFPIGTKFT